MDIATSTQRENEQRVAEEYLSSLSDLNCNSKPLINMLTMLAEENIEFAPVIVKVVEQHIAKVPSEIKLPILYLIDSIVKNVKSTYVQLFGQCIVNIFCGAFEKVNEKIRERMYALRQTWNEVFSAQKLYALDVKVKCLDHNWPITAKQPSIHVNPNFLKANAAQAIPTEMEKILQDKTRELLELKKRKLELELEATKKHLEEQEKQFSKTAEGVIQPVDALVAANVGIRAPSMTPQMMPGIMPPGYMGGPPTNIAVNPAMRPGMFHPNMRAFRPNMHPNMMNVPPQSNMMPGVMTAGNIINKPKVHPVNSALLNSVRQRDPRLQRQQLQQQRQLQMQQNQNGGDRSPNRQQNMRSSHSDKDKHDSNHKINHKSPTRMPSNSRSSGSNRSGKNSQRDRDRDRERERERERDRKRSESKSSTTSSSSSGSTNANNERKKGFAKSSEKHSSKCDKDAFEIAPLSTAFKRKSSSPASSPSKSRDSKRINTQKSRHTSRSKTRSRSRSPDDKISSSKSPYGDIDLRHTSTASTSSARMNSPDKRTKTSNADTEIMTSTLNDKEDLTTKLPSATISSSSTDKDLDKIATTTTTTTAATATGGAAAGNNSNHLTLETLKDTVMVKKDENSQLVSKDNEEDVKKRPLSIVKDEEPLAKKSKSAKIDALFGSEDVDLRQLIPPVLAAPSSPDIDIAPPPPSINISNEISRDTENWDNLKTDNNKNLAAKTTKSSLEDVRAKLAKTAKLSKLSKLDKLTRDIDHRNKLSELQMTDDTQEANDEKIRTMITQAQELLESNSINQEQYKHLIKTVMSINETNKLKEAKRRESLNAIKQKLTAMSDDGPNDSAERNLAMQAVLKKRIPKLNKGQAMNEQNTNTDSQQGGSNAGGNNEDLPQNEDKQDSNEEPTSAMQTSSGRTIRGQREKRGPKVSKWGERVIDPPVTGNMSMGPGGPQQRPWNPLMGPNKRSGIQPFRSNGPQNTRPPWPISGGGGGGGNVNNMSGPPHFGKSHMGPMRGNAMPAVGPPPVPVIPKPCNSIDNPQEDLVRTITIDGAVKEIRFYDKVAIVFMEVDQPREIGFQNGQRSICIDNNDPVVLHFNDAYKAVQIDGETFNLRFGFPSRELYIDDHWYEIYFGGPPISVPIRNKIHMLKAEGPPPQVNIGPLRRDLVVGKINMIVDAHNVIPLFLDARMQTFRLADKEHTIQFADNLLTVLLDGTPTRVEYGGLPKSLYLGGKKYFVRFGALPQGVIAGKVLIKDMLYVETKPPNEEEVANEPTVENVTSSVTTSAEINPVELQTSSTPASVPILPAAALSNINIDELFQKLVSTGILGGSSGILPAVTNAASTPTTTGETKTESNQSLTSVSAESPPTEEVPPPPPSVHMEPIKPIDLSRPESVKTRQAAIVETLFSGMQCSSCGVRFPPEQTIKYSQHLDWHFRQNRRERDASRKAHARKWYYDLNDWVQYEEIEDLEEREKNFFETQQNDPETFDDASNQRSTNSPIPTCPAGADDVDRACNMCQEKFEQFYDNELEEWHLRCAIRIEDKIYHPLCYEDYKASLNPPAPTNNEEEESRTTDNNEISLIQIEDDNAVDIVIKVEDDKDDKKEEEDTSNALVVDDDDDDVIVLPNEEPSVTEIVDDDDEDEYVPANVTREHMGNVHEGEEGQGEHNETTESDVEIQEPHIPFTDLDTYVEKEKEDDVTEVSFMSVKIKEEPKEDEDEDDGFEEVGTVVQAPEEISLNSSEDTQIQTIESSNTALSPLAERPPSTTPFVNHNEDIDSRLEPPAIDLNISMDGNIDTGDEHNLSAAGHVPSVPLASLVNKIKINITKNSVTTSSNTSTSSNNVTGLSTTSSNLLNQTDSLGHAATSAANPIPTISTIPVLCGGTTISSIVGSGLSGDYDEYSAIDELGENSVSTISVIGSYGSAAPTITHLNRPVVASVISTQPAKPATPPPIEETITYELKPVLQKASLKKREKVICGNETSGLCSIM